FVATLPAIGHLVSSRNILIIVIFLVDPVDRHDGCGSGHREPFALDHDSMIPSTIALKISLVDLPDSYAFPMLLDALQSISWPNAFESLSSPHSPRSRAMSPTSFKTMTTPTPALPIATT